MANHKGKNSYNREKSGYNKEKNDYSKEKDLARTEFNGKDFSTDSLSHPLIDVIKNFMQYHVDDITSSQLRNVYSIILNKDMGGAAKRVKIAYAAARNSKTGMRTLLNKLDKMLSGNIGYETIRNFTEACVAYHKYFESLKKR
jgi:CRISPR/Cas system CSM-associated protein Csm2 small subunit